MKKIININLSGRVIPIEDAAYDGLQRYIESLRRYFAAEEGRDEIINDIESRIAELMNDKVRKGAAAVTEADINEIINAMGRVEDFEAAEAEGETLSSTKSYTNNTQSDSGGSSRRNFSGRLYRDANDKFIGGVCAGIAAYINVDPTIVRLVFAIITFGGFGFGFLLYILLWILLPARSMPVALSGNKRFFRNPDDRIFGGVAGGLGAYFNVRPWVLRLVFAAPLLLNIFFGFINGAFFVFFRDRDLFPNFFIGSFTGTFILIYIILWIVLPVAKSPFEKMEMRGETVDVNRIKQNVQEGMGDFKERMAAWGEEVKEAGQRLGARAQEFGRTYGSEAARSARPVGRGIGHAIGVLFKVFFLFIAGVIAFSLFVALLVFTFGGIAQPVNAFLIDGFWQRTFLWSTVVLFLAVPLIGLIVWIIRRAMNVRSQNRYLGWIFGGLWTLGWVALTLFVSSLVKDFRFTERAEREVPLSRSSMNKLVVQVPGSPIRYSGNYDWLNPDDNEQGWDITDDSLLLSNIRITVKQSRDSFYHVTLYRYSNGSNRALALRRAESIDYSVSSRDSVLLLGSGFGLGRDDKFRGQKAMVEIEVPVGKQIRFDHSVGEKLNPYDIRVGDNEWRNRRSWNRRDWRFDWDNNWYYEWKPDTDYYMTANGQLKEVDIPETEKTTTPEEPKDTIPQGQNTKLQQQKADEDAVEESLSQDEQTTQAKEMGGEVPTPAAMPFVPTIF